MSRDPASNPTSIRCREDLIRALSAPPYWTVVDHRDDPGYTRSLLDALKSGDEGGSDKISYTEISVQPGLDADRGLVTRLSRTSAAMPPHTDSSYSGAPHSLLAFDMVETDEEGGVSILVDANRLLERLDEATARLLALPIFPFGSRRFPILAGARHDVRVRYYRAQIDKSIGEGLPLPANAVEALERLDEMLADESLQERVRLQGGQVLFIANNRVLHGRTGLAEGSRRLMHRYRMRIPELA